ncbi:hypothetical protein BD626DRAFT_278334 [Schizophyllum amplum]|uniref:Fungal-type protein kinase domain-containing protein n=1 Tax=Schizophyllum amplum TaxID=97359 RepID=A0A550BTF4_9AGAR|nr:hypothetical protein BD626DRAFT_278334 [Auriculariopsis ampla]
MLNDWDLAETDVRRDVKLSPPPLNSRPPPGTLESLDASTPPTRSALVHFTRPLHIIPFADIDLLNAVRCGEVRHHLYRHDLEAFIWIFVWVGYCYDGEKKLDDTGMNPSLKTWSTGT